MTTAKIISLLPYTAPFLFVDNLETINEEGVVGTYTYPADAFFYKGHFIDNPITPGVILTETMAQIGLACLAIFLSRDKILQGNPLPQIAMVAQQTDYFMPVFPEETVSVYSKKEYFRFGKLKCQVEMQNDKNEVICKGIIAGMISKL